MIPALLRVPFVPIVIFLAAVVFLFIVFFIVWVFPEEDTSSYISGIDATILWNRSVHAQWYAHLSRLAGHLFAPSRGGLEVKA